MTGEEFTPLTTEQLTQYEWEFVANVIWAASTSPNTKVRSERDQQKDHKRAFEVFDRIDAEMISDPAMRTIYRIVSDMFASGAMVEVSKLGFAIANHIDTDHTHTEAWADLSQNTFMSSLLESRAEIVEREYRRREFKSMLVKAETMLNGPHGADGGQRLAGVMSSRLIELYVGKGRGQQNQYPTSDEVVDELLHRAVTGEERGIKFPWPKLEEHCGPMIPGECVGVTAYSGQGKSLFASNLYWELALSGVNVIAFPTEMMYQWVERGIARNADVSQWRAEKGKWRDPEGEEEFHEYRKALEFARKLPNWRVVARANITPVEVALSVRILRKNWPGEAVVFLVDHMHRLDYGKEKSDEVVGEATKLLRNVGQEDGELLPILLFQPKKPEGSKQPYGPTGGHRIRGHSSVWNELDLHLCPWRAVVETVSDPDDKTPQGTPKARRDRHGLPIIKKPTEQMFDRKWDDENFHIKIDKRRTGGPGPNIVLPLNPTSGRIHVPAQHEIAEDRLSHLHT